MKCCISGSWVTTSVAGLRRIESFQHAAHGLSAARTGLRKAIHALEHVFADRAQLRIREQLDRRGIMRPRLAAVDVPASVWCGLRCRALLQRCVKLPRRLRRPLQILQCDAMRCELAKELRAGRRGVFAHHDNDKAILLRRCVQRHGEQILRGAAIGIDLAAGPEIGGELFEKWLRRDNPVPGRECGRYADLPEGSEQAASLFRSQRFQPHALPLEGAALGGKAPVEDDDLAQKGGCDSDGQLLQQREMRGGKLLRLRRIAGEAGGGELIGRHRSHLTPAPQWERP